MKNNDVLSNLSSAHLLDLLGLQSKPTATSRALTYAGFVGIGLVLGATAAVFLTPKSGRQMRTDLRDRARELGHNATSTASSALDATQHRIAEFTNQTAGAGGKV